MSGAWRREVPAAAQLTIFLRWRWVWKQIALRMRGNDVVLLAHCSGTWNPLYWQVRATTPPRNARGSSGSHEREFHSPVLGLSAGVICGAPLRPGRVTRAANSFAVRLRVALCGFVTVLVAQFLQVAAELTSVFILLYFDSGKREAVGSQVVDEGSHSALAKVVGDRRAV